VRALRKSCLKMDILFTYLSVDSACLGFNFSKIINRVVVGDASLQKFNFSRKTRDVHMYMRVWYFFYLNLSKFYEVQLSLNV